VLNRALAHCPKSDTLSAVVASKARMLRETIGNPRVFGIALVDALNDRAAEFLETASDIAFPFVCTVPQECMFRGNGALRALGFRICAALNCQTRTCHVLI